MLRAFWAPGRLLQQHPPRHSGVSNSPFAVCGSQRQQAPFQASLKYWETKEMQFCNWSPWQALSLLLSQLLCCRSSTLMSAILSAYRGRKRTQCQLTPRLISTLRIRCAFTLHAAHRMEMTTSYAASSLSYYRKKSIKKAAEKRQEKRPEIELPTFELLPSVYTTRVPQISAHNAVLGA